MTRQPLSFRAALLCAAAFIAVSCAAAPAYAANPPSLAAQCKQEAAGLGALVGLIQAAETQAEVDHVVGVLTRIAEAQPALVQAALDANKAGLSAAYVRKAYAEACLAGVI